MAILQLHLLHNFLLIKCGALFRMNTGSVCWQCLKRLNWTGFCFCCWAFRHLRRCSHILRLWYYRKCLWIQLRLLCKCAHKAAAVCGVRYIVIIVVSILYCFCLNTVCRADCVCVWMCRAGRIFVLSFYWVCAGYAKILYYVVVCMLF